MDKNPNKHNRRSIRLRGFDYSSVGAYFVTICTHKHKCVFGEVINSQMVLNDAGMMVQEVWDQIRGNYTGVETDEFVIMPNHIHGIIVLVGAAPRGRPDGYHACAENEYGATGQPQGVAPTLSLPDVVLRFKTMTTKRYADSVKEYGWPSFPGKLWQRNYYEHIIRNEIEWKHLREYIINNPVKWECDRNHPSVWEHTW
ncbi:MAG: hypothetical protein JXA62_06425 [Candidatus Aminicenantes bacterium]|nr:hypothetical protein [Candidatus Aminicenantes bacterium]